MGDYGRYSSYYNYQSEPYQPTTYSGSDANGYYYGQQQESGSLLGSSAPRTDTYQSQDPYGIRSMASNSRSQSRDLKALQAVQQELNTQPTLYPSQEHGGVASWTRATLEQMANSEQASPEAKVGAQRLLSQPGLFEKVDNSMSGTSTLDDGWFQMGELDATQERVQSSGMDYFYGALNPLTMDSAATYRNTMAITDEAANKQ